MCQRENLGANKVTTIDEDQRSVFIHDGETSKFVRVELAAGVIVNHPVVDNHHTSVLDTLPQEPERISPRGLPRSPSCFEAKDGSHLTSDPFRRGSHWPRADKRQRVYTFVDQLFTHPRNATLHRVNCFQEFWAW